MRIPQNSALIRVAAFPGGALAVGSARTSDFFSSLGVRQLFDASDESPFAAFRAARASGLLSNRMAAFQPDDGSKSGCLAAYATFGRMPTVEFPKDGSPASSAVMASFSASHLNAAMGWFTNWDEYQYVSHLNGALARSRARNVHSFLATRSSSHWRMAPYIRSPSRDSPCCVRPCLGLVK